MPDNATMPDMRVLHDVIMRASDDINNPLPPKKPENVVPLSSHIQHSVLEEIKNNAERHRHGIDSTIDESTAYVTAELNKLVAQLLQVGQIAVDRAEQAKAVSKEHIDWVVEAARFSETIRARISMLVPLEEPQIPQEPVKTRQSNS